jgi:hypothetical protein
LGHEKSDDETDYDQTQGSGSVGGHEYIEHSDGQADQDDADEGKG